MKKNINEELNYIKFLFDYKKGVVISEQEVVTTKTTIDPSMKKSAETFNPQDNKVYSKKEVGVYGDPPTTQQTTTQQTTTQQTTTQQTDMSQTQSDNYSELQTQKQELESKMNSIQSNLDVLERKRESEERQRYELSIIKKLEDIDSFLKESCSKKMTKLCKEYLKEKNTYNSHLAKLRNLTTQENNKDFEEKRGEDSADKTKKWVEVVSSILTLITGSITTAFLVSRPKD